MVGKVFITLGLLILAFVGYQLWGTGIEFRANQRDLASEFRRTVASNVQTSTTVTDTPAVESTPETDTPTTGNAGTGDSDPETSSTGLPTTTNPLDRLKQGDVLAAITMPSISSTTYYIVSGVGSADLKRGIGHYPKTALPGQFGNAALAGHRTTYGAPFENIDRLRAGDVVVVDTINGGHYEYVVEGHEIIKPEQIEVLAAPKDPEAVLLTLTTCHPKRSVAQRLIVHARLRPETSSAVAPRSDTYSAETPAPPAIAPTTTAASSTPEEQPAETSAAAPTTAQPATTAVPATTVLAGTAPSTAPDSTVADTVVDELAGDDVAPPDATAVDNLTTGWFRDTAAWPQIILWGLGLIAIAIGIHFGGRRIGKRWLAVAAGAIPFLVVLYFFFQNVNRLLPPGL